MPRKPKATEALTVVKTSPKVRAARKQYVLDTNVLLHDPTSLYRFQEHDVYLPMTVLGELDKHKRGTEDLARNAREVTRQLDRLLAGGSMQKGFPLDHACSGQATGRLFFIDTNVEGIADDKILACAQELAKAGDAVLVTKDINLRVKAMACQIAAQDYRNDRVVDDADLLPTGFQVVDSTYWEQNASTAGDAFWRQGGRDYALINPTLPLNSYLVEEVPGDANARLWRVMEHGSAGESQLARVSSRRRGLIAPRNNEQAMALDLLFDPEIDVVSLLGPAGTGKTLLAIAAGLEQVQSGLFQEVLVTRATVPMGEEIGFLPGTEAEKMDAWLGGTLRDAFSVLKLDDDARPTKNNPEPLRSKVEVASMSFMRGRSFQGKFILIDEAQNLTSRQMRSLLTRAGEGCKVVLTGNTAQIDSPYLDEGSSGLAWAVKKLQNWAHAGSLILRQGVRSRLATYVEDVASRSS